jgi:hypothetical protein
LNICRFFKDNKDKYNTFYVDINNIKEIQNNFIFNNNYVEQSLQIIDNHQSTDFKLIKDLEELSKEINSYLKNNESDYDFFNPNFYIEELANKLKQFFERYFYSDLNKFIEYYKSINFHCAMYVKLREELLEYLDSIATNKDVGFENFDDFNFVNNFFVTIPIMEKEIKKLKTKYDDIVILKLEFMKNQLVEIEKYKINYKKSSNKIETEYNIKDSDFILNLLKNINVDI